MSKKSLNVPTAMQPVYDTIVALIDPICAAHLNAEYAEMARFATAALCRKHPSPLTSGQPKSWACGIVYALGFVNFLFDNSNTPHLNAEALCSAFGVSKSNGAAKSKQVRDALNLIQLDPDWCLPSMADRNPMMWILKVNGILVDIRDMPREAQVVAYENGLIPYIPADQNSPPASQPDVAASAPPPAKPAKSSQTGKASGSIYQLKVTLLGSTPPIWRRILIASDTRLNDLHEILQDVMGWSNSHLHQFITGKRPALQFYAPQEYNDGFMETEDENKYKISDIAPREKDKFVYEYDFGNSWEHQIVVEKILPRQADTHYPVCLKGARACPPEDSGGVWGYEEFLEALKKPDNPEYEEQVEWIGKDFDPEYFDIEAINQVLSQHQKHSNKK
jgi:hypothetical protein